MPHGRNRSGKSGIVPSQSGYIVTRSCGSGFRERQKAQKTNRGRANHHHDPRALPSPRVRAFPIYYRRVIVSRCPISKQHYRHAFHLTGNTQPGSPDHVAQNRYKSRLDWKETMLRCEVSMFSSLLALLTAGLSETRDRVVGVSYSRCCLFRRTVC